MFGEGHFLTCIMDMAIKLSPLSYVYLFDYQYEFSFNKLLDQYGKPHGVAHGDEMIGFFSLKVVNPKGLKENDEKMSKLMVNIWVMFASSK